MNAVFRLVCHRLLVVLTLGFVVLLSACNITINCGPPPPAPGVRRLDGPSANAGALVPSKIQALINIDFGAGTSTAKTGPAAVGLSARDYWNFYTRDEGGNPQQWRQVGALSRLRDHQGTDCGAGLVIRNAPGAWGNGSPDPMYASYLYPFDYRQNMTIALTNLPPARYDIYLYGHTAGDGGNSRYELVLDEQPCGSRTTASQGWQEPLWVEGVHYVVFRDVRVASREQILEVVVHPDQAHALVAGMQLARRK